MWSASISGGNVTHKKKPPFGAGHLTDPSNSRSSARAMTVRFS
jgi:hypothetical protein